MFWGKQIRDIQKKIDDLVKESKQNHKDNDSRLDNIEKVLIMQEVNLKEHMRRSDHLEELVVQNEKKYSRDMAPLQKHINMVEGVFKFIGILGIVISILGGIAKLLGFI